MKIIQRELARGRRVLKHVLRGAVVGTGAYLIGYVLSFVFMLFDGLESVLDSQGWKVVGWVVYGTHNVPLSIAGIPEKALQRGMGIPSSFSVFDISDGRVATSDVELAATVPQFLYMLLPVVVLVGAGYVICRLSDVQNSSRFRTAAIGATVVAGYLVPSFLGVLVFTVPQGATGWMLVRPEPGSAVFLMSLLYPLVLGAAGAVLARKQARPAPDSIGLDHTVRNHGPATISGTPDTRCAG